MDQMVSAPITNHQEAIMASNKTLGFRFNSFVAGGSKEVWLNQDVSALADTKAAVKKTAATASGRKGLPLSRDEEAELASLRDQADSAEAGYWSAYFPLAGEYEVEIAKARAMASEIEAGRAPHPLNVESAAWVAQEVRERGEGKLTAVKPLKFGELSDKARSPKRAIVEAVCGELGHPAEGLVVELVLEALDGLQLHTPVGVAALGRRLAAAGETVRQAQLRLELSLLRVAVGVSGRRCEEHCSQRAGAALRQGMAIDDGGFVAGLGEAFAQGVMAGVMGHPMASKMGIPMPGKPAAPPSTQMRRVARPGARNGLVEIPGGELADATADAVPVAAPRKVDTLEGQLAALEEEQKIISQRRKALTDAAKKAAAVKA